MEDLIKTIGTNAVNVISDAIRAGRSRKDAENDLARAVERGDIVSDELYSRMLSYISKTKNFEENG